jgi:hypothetical protein
VDALARSGRLEQARLAFDDVASISLAELSGSG